jgi:hypothetical protein
MKIHESLPPSRPEGLPDDLPELITDDDHPLRRDGAYITNSYASFDFRGYQGEIFWPEIDSTDNLESYLGVEDAVINVEIFGGVENLTDVTFTRNELEDVKKMFPGYELRLLVLKAIEGIETARTAVEQTKD